jgi:hypothetical protein
MSDQLAEQLRASTISDNNAGSSSEDWKSNLNLPAKDGRHQTEVGAEPSKHAPIQVSIALSNLMFFSLAGCDKHKGTRMGELCP